MALISDNEVQLRISATADGQGEVDSLSNSVSDLEKDLAAVATAAQESAAKQAEAAQRLQAAKAVQDDARLALAKAREEYRQLAAQAQASGASQGEFAAKAQAAKLRVAELSGQMAAATGNVRILSAEYRKQTNDTSRLNEESNRLKQRIGEIGGASQAAAAEAVPANNRIKESLTSIGSQLNELKILYASWIAVQQAAGAVSGIASTADAYANLQAKLKLVVGDGQALKDAFAGVQQVALSTNSTLESTGALFAKIADIGKTMGVSQQDALRLTETINQTIQLSGAAAQAADAAIVQLIQGLQSGVVRGDEFNSIMEQAPRLSKAMSEGLGVTTGELRKMAEAGQLTAETVISALQGQAQVIESEFSQLPATIGRAITNLESQWQLFIGAMDESSGASATAAAAIDALANNLDLVASSLMNAGQAYLAWKAYNIAAEFLGLKAAVAASTAAKTADTAATIANTTATAANTAAQISNNAAKTGAAVAADAAAAGAGRLAGALSLIKGFGLAFLVTNFMDIGKWIGEAAAKAMGYGKALEDAEIKARAMEAATKAQAAETAALAQKLKLASDAALGLDENGKRIVAMFEDLKTKGETTAEAIAKISKELDLSNLDGIEQAGAALDALGERGKLSAEEIRLAWQQALSGKDLQAFAVEAMAAFDETEQGARRLAAAMDAQLSEAIRRTGKDFGELSNGINVAAQRAINDFDVLAGSLDALGQKGVDVGITLAASLEKATSAATTTAALEEVIRRWQELGQAGLLAGDQMAAGIEKAQRKLEDITPGINGLEEAFRQLGMKSPQELQKVADSSRQAFDEIKRGTEKTEGGLKLIGQAFIRYAENALQANGGVVTDAMRVEAAMAGVEIKVDGAGKAMFTYKDAAEAAGQGSNNAASGADRLSQSLQKVKKDADAAKKAILQLGEVQDNGDGTVSMTKAAAVNIDMEEVLYQMGASTKEADALSSDAMANFKRALSTRSANGQAPNYDQMIKAAAREALEASRTEAETQRLNDMRSRGRGDPARPPVQQNIHRVEIDLGGRRQSVSVASEADAATLVDLFRQLERDAGRAN